MRCSRTDVDDRTQRMGRDDPNFVCIVEALISGAVAVEKPEFVVIVKTDHWFGSRWCGYVW
ncbi:MAG: hypothetical protein MJE77_44000 [Proteobacteria bacterium]|nr:hypothetical protein [Pseudomonadota bacterium]